MIGGRRAPYDERRQIRRMFGFAFMAVIAVMFSAVADPWIARLSWQGIAAMAMYGALASPAARLSRSWLRRTWDNLGRPSDLD